MLDSIEKGGGNGRGGKGIFHNFFKKGEIGGEEFGTEP